MQQHLKNVERSEELKGRAVLAQQQIVDSPSEVPAFATEAEAQAFWTAHTPSAAFARAVGLTRDARLPAPRPQQIPISIRFDSEILDRLKNLAVLCNLPYQRLIKKFVVERLYEEEKRVHEQDVAAYAVAARH